MYYSGKFLYRGGGVEGERKRERERERESERRRELVISLSCGKQSTFSLKVHVDRKILNKCKRTPIQKLEIFFTKLEHQGPFTKQKI